MVTILPCNANISNSLTTAVLSLVLAVVAIWASTKRVSQHQALIICKAEPRWAGSSGLRKTLPSMAMTPVEVSLKRASESLKTRTELVGIELAKHAAEGVVARDPVLQLQKVAEEFLLGLGKYGHVDRGLAAGQDGAQRDHQNLPKVVPSGVDPRGSFSAAKQSSNPCIAPSAALPRGSAERVGSAVTKAVRRFRGSGLASEAGASISRASPAQVTRVLPMASAGRRTDDNE